ncbi:hypothetical protein KL86DES1_21387 [uncultured Desulfovibrio sp.]|uniref:Uncharacterized protein n=1 Tax=uncultured Desulfovibrio sp. TaxID=167968 RepID=A0A212L7L7_9BACT|nr:hypothetical protein KL86DES1_21387 [uncultured Desulfovibrio sp.]VZH34284.1 conserved protein of unknown function [Desulfovibrio sp. 86]
MIVPFFEQQNHNGSKFLEDKFLMTFTTVKVLEFLILLYINFAASLFFSAI